MDETVESIRKLSFKFLPLLVLRTPSLPYALWECNVDELLSSDAFRTAVAISSPSLHGALEKKNLNFVD